jgi:short-subunit dehydrogenase
VRGFTECLAKELKGSNVQIHSVHPGHIGTNIVTNARMNTKEDKVNPMQEMMGKLIGIGSTQEEMADFFRNNGMHPSRASNIILKGVLKNKSRIFIGADAKLMDLSQRLTPMHYDKLFPLFTLPLMLLRNKKPLQY